MPTTLTCQGVVKLDNPYSWSVLYLSYQGESDIEQLCKVLQCLGTPNEENWPVSLLQIEDSHNSKKI